MGKAFSQLSSRGSATASSSPELWNQDLRRTICVLGAGAAGSNSSVAAVSASINERVKGKQLPFDAVVDKTEVFYEEQLYFGRMGSEAMRTDHRAEVFAKLAALVFVLDATDLSSAFKFEWKRGGYQHEFDVADSLAHDKLTMKESEDWLLQMTNRRLDVLVDKPILIILTNAHATGASTAEQAAERLLAKHLTGRNIRVQECGECCDTTTAGGAPSGLQEGVEWLSEQVHNVRKARRFLSNKKNHPINSNVVLGKLNRHGSVSTPPLVVKSGTSKPFTLSSLISAAKVAM